MQNTLFKNISLVNEGKIIRTDVYVKRQRIEKIAPQISVRERVDEIIGDSLHLLPGVIDEHVHFREPGLTQKADIFTESRAAVAGGVTSFMEMPNTIPNVLTGEILEEKYRIASAKSLANYSFYMGMSNSNAEEILKLNQHKNEICGVKIFMGSSTGNMLVDSATALNKIFADSELLIATHCEDEATIHRNLEKLKSERVEFGPADHALIRDEEACYISSEHTVALAQKHSSRLHIVHITTGKELSLFENDIPLRDKKITSEVCVHHLHFTADDYQQLDYQIKCNPSIKEKHNKEALWQGLLDNHIDTIATDHAPHLWSEKQPPYDKAKSGLPLVQHALPLMLYYRSQGRISIERIVEKMAHAVAECYHIKDRGYVREGYFADLAVVDLNHSFTAKKDNILYKCGWSPLDGFQFPSSVVQTYVSGNLVFDQGKILEAGNGERLVFER